MSFLDAPPHLYKRVRASVGPSVRPSVGRSRMPSHKRVLGASYAVHSALLLLLFIGTGRPRFRNFSCMFVCVCMDTNACECAGVPVCMKRVNEKGENKHLRGFLENA